MSLRSERLCAPLILILLLVMAAQAFLFPRTASADRKYFVETYTPYLVPAGEAELESWLTSRSGQTGTGPGVQWDWRQELEYGVTDRLTAAAYLNFSQPSGGSLEFKSPSLELIYRLGDHGRFPGDPALYFEATETGEELELEPKLLLGTRTGRLVSALNLIGEFEFRHNDEELLGSGAIFRNQWAWGVSGGTCYELTRHVAAGLETRYHAEYPNFGPRSGSALYLGPSINLQTEKVQISLGVLRQLRGSPKTSGDLNLDEFERTEVRTVIGVTL